MQNIFKKYIFKKMENAQIEESIKINNEIKKLLMEKLKIISNIDEKIDILDKIKKIDENINFYKCLIANNSKYKL